MKRKIMKKKTITMLLSTSMIFSSSMIVVRADDEANVTDIYADLHDITITTDQAASDAVTAVITDRNGNTVNSDVTVNGTTITVSPSENLMPDKRYTLNLSGGIKSYTKNFAVEIIGKETFDDKVVVAHKGIYSKDDTEQTNKLGYAGLGSNQEGVSGWTIINGAAVYNTTGGNYVPYFEGIEKAKRFTMEWDSTFLNDDINKANNSVMRLIYNGESNTVGDIGQSYGLYEVQFGAGLNTKLANFRSRTSTASSVKLLKTAPAQTIGMPDGTITWNSDNLSESTIEFNETQPYSHYRFVKDGKYFKLYRDNVLGVDSADTSVADYTNDAYGAETGYFHFKIATAAALWLDNVVCTAFSDLDTDEYQLTATGAYNGFSSTYDITFSKDISKVSPEDIAGITVSDGNSNIDVNYTARENVLSISGDFDENTEYTITADNAVIGIYNLASFEGKFRIADLYQYIAVSSYNYDITTDKIIITFDKPLDGLTDFSKAILTKGSEEVEIDCVVSDNDLIITPAAPLERDTAYDIEIKSGFGTALTKTNTGFIKQFTIKTLYSQNFDNITDLKDDDNLKTLSGYASVENGELHVGKEQTNSQGVTSIAVDALYFAPETVSEYENYVFSADITQIDTAPYCIFSYNASDVDRLSSQISASGYGLALRRPWYELSVDGTKIANTTDVAEAAINNSERVTGFDDAGGALQTGDTTTKYSYKLVKTGSNAKLFANSRNIINFNVDEKADNILYKTETKLSDVAKKTKGYLGFGAAKNEVIIDNIDIYSIVWSENDMSLAGEISGLTGTVAVKNYTDTNKPTVLIAAAYSKNNEMVGAKVLKHGETEAYSSERYSYDLSGCADASEVKVFLWDSFETIKPYCSAAGGILN